VADFGILETAAIVSAVAAASSAAATGVASSQQASAQANAASYNATVQHQAGVQASNTAASNEATSLRRSSADLGEQAAAFGEANIGTGGSVAGVEKQSRASAQEDALNIWYGGELERKGAFASAKLENYQSDVYQQQSKNALIGGGIGAGTALLSGAANYYGGRKYGYGSYGGFGGFGSGGPTF
jgi:hypothetical protein